MEFLDDRSKLLARVTCREWFKTIKCYNFEFLYTRIEQLPAIIERMSKYTHPIGLKFRKSYFDKRSNPHDIDATPFLEISRLTQLTRLVIPDREFPTMDWLRLTTLTNLQFIYIRSEGQGPLDSGLLFKFPNLKELPRTLYDSDCDLINLEHVWTNLETLDVHFAEENENLIERLKFLPRLTSLTVSAAKNTTFTLGVATLTFLTQLKSLVWDNIHPVLHSSLPNLESLSVREAPSDRLDLNTNLTYLYTEDMSKLNGITNLTKLKILGLRNVEDLFPSIVQLTALKNLEELQLNWFAQSFTLDQIAPYIKSTNFSKLWLYISVGSEITLTPQISHLTALQFLLIHSGSQLHYVSSLTNLTSLILYKAMDPDQTCVTKLTNLKRFEVNSYGMTDEVSINLANLTNLEYLTLTFRKLNPKDSSLNMDHLTRLQSLNINASLETFDIDLLKFPHLTSLGLNSRNIRGFWNMATSLTTLKELYLNDNQTEPVLCLTSLTQLTRLTMQCSSSEIRQHFTHLTF